MRYVVAFLLVVLAPSYAYANCDSPDNINYVSGKNLCLAIKTYMPPGEVNKPVLRVWLHGDVSKGGPADYMYKRARRSTTNNLISVAMLRPGHYDKNGKRSDDKTYGKKNWETEETIDSITDAVKKLKKHHNASKVVMIGHSGGCNISAVMIGRHPGLVDTAILVACACDKEMKRLIQGRSYNSDDVNPLDYVDYVPVTTKVIALTGDEDSTNPIEVCKPYIGYLKKRGVNARLDIVSGARHGFGRLRRSDEYKDALRETSK